MPLPRPSPPALWLFASSWLVAAAGNAAATAAAEGGSPAHSSESWRPQRQRLVRSEAALERLVVGSRAEVSRERVPKAVRPVLQRLHAEAYDGSRFWHLGKAMQDDFTISLQFRTNSSAGSGTSWFGGVGLLGAAHWGLEGDFGLAMGDGKVLFGGGKRTAASSRSYAYDMWHTVVASRDTATGACSLWVDGEFQRTITCSKGSPKPSHDMDLGRITSGHGYFVGYLKDVEIYDKVLTPEDIDFAKEVEAKKRRVGEHQPLLEELEVQDFFGDTFKEYERFVQDDFTIVLDFKTDSSAGSATHWWAGVGLIGAGAPGASQDFGLSMGGGYVLFGIANPDTTIISGERYDDNKWHTVVAERTRKTGEFSLWIDGIFGTSAVGSQHSLMGSDHLDVGRLSNHSGYFRGNLRNLRIFGEALTPLDLGMEAADANDVQGRVWTTRSKEQAENASATQGKVLLEGASAEAANAKATQGKVLLEGASAQASSATAEQSWPLLNFELDESEEVHQATPATAEESGPLLNLEEGESVEVHKATPATAEESWPLLNFEEGESVEVHKAADASATQAKELLGGTSAEAADASATQAKVLLGSTSAKDLDRERRERKADTQRLVDPILAEQEKFRDEFRKAADASAMQAKVLLGGTSAEAADASAKQGKVRLGGASAEAADASATQGKVQLGGASAEAADTSATQGKVLLGGTSAEAADAIATHGKVRLGGANVEATSATAKESWPLSWSVSNFGGGDTAQVQEHKVSCSGVTAGDRFLQLGTWRLGDADGEHFSVASGQGQAAHVYSSKGTAQPGPSNQHLIWQRGSTISGISLGDHFIQIGNWRLGEADACHFSISHRSGWVAQIFKCDGTVQNGPRKDYSTWNRTTGIARDISFGNHFVEIGDWRIGAADDRHLSIAHFKGKTSMVFRTDGRSFPGNGSITDYAGTWERPAKICSPLLVLPTCRGLQVGDRFIQMGKWRLGDVEGVRLSMSHEGGAVAQIWWSSGKIGLGSGPPDGHLFHHLTTWNRMLGPASGISFGDRFIQIGLWRLGEVDESTFSISHLKGGTAQTFHKNGTVDDSPGNNTELWERFAGDASGVIFGDRFIEIGQWRIGDVDGHHASIAHQRRKTFVIFKNDGKVLRGPREDYTTLSQHTEVCDLLAPPAAKCVLTLDNPSETKRRYSSRAGEGQSVLDSNQAWVAQEPRDGEWMELDLGAVKQVAGMVLQSRVDQRFQWISQYRLNHSKDGKKWDPVLGLFRGATAWFWKSTQTIARPLFECGGGSTLHNPPENKRAYSSVLANGRPGSTNALSKLNSKQAWISGFTALNEYLQIDLGRTHLVTGVVTQGGIGLTDWTTHFAVICSADGNTWNEAGAYFVGNADSNTQVTNIFPYAVWARYLRILPLAWHRKIAMRAGVLACKAPGSPPISLASLATPRRAQHLHAGKAVSPEERQTQVLTEPGPPARPVERQAPAPAEPVPLASKPRPQLLKQTLSLGVRQQQPPKLQPTALPPVRSRWKLGRHRRQAPPPALRHPALQMMVKVRGGQRSQRHLSSKRRRATPRRRRSILAPVAETTATAKECPSSLENPAEASRSYSSVYQGQQPGDAHARSAVDSQQAWTAGVSQAGEWMQLDLGKLAKVVATVVQGRKDWPQWVTAYQVRCSQDGVEWTEVQRDFDGNTDQSTKVFNWFPHPVEARYVRLVVLSYHTKIAMRAAVLACKEGHSAARRRRSQPVEIGMEARLTKMGYRRCSKEGQDCNCSGIVVYGQGSSWTSLRVDKTVSCSASAFQGAEQPVSLDWPARECRCKDLAWCFQAERNGAVLTLHDSEHRRRAASGRVGVNHYQRRRLCGWGPRECLYFPWGDWGDCHEDCLQMRERKREAPARNGGSCAVASVDSRPCSSC